MNVDHKMFVSLQRNQIQSTPPPHLFWMLCWFQWLSGFMSEFNQNQENSIEVDYKTTKTEFIF